MLLDCSVGLQLKTLLVATGVAKAAESRAKGNAGAYAVRHTLTLPSPSNGEPLP